MWKNHTQTNQKTRKRPFPHRSLQMQQLRQHLQGSTVPNSRAFRIKKLVLVQSSGFETVGRQLDKLPG